MVIRAYGAALTAGALEVDLLCTGDKRGATPGGPQPHGDALKIYLATGPNGSAEVLDMLLEHGADPNLRFYGETPLTNAASWCALDAIQLLVQAGADPGLRNDHGQSALDEVCSAPESLSKPTVAYLNTAMASNRHRSGP